MSGNLQQLYHSITGTLMAPGAVEERLRELTREYPYFAAPHFFLLAKTIQHDGDIELLPAKTNLLFNNPHWLEFQLGKYFTPDQSVLAIKGEMIQEFHHTHASDQESEIEVVERVDQALPVAASEVLETGHPIAEMESSLVSEEIAVTESEQEVILTSPDAHTEMEPLPALNHSQAPIEAIALETGWDAASTDIIDNVTISIPAETDHQEKIVIDKEMELGVQELEASATDLQESLVNKDIKAIVEEPSGNNEAVSEAMQLSISNTVQDQVDASNEQLESDPLLPLFEPLHTTDYFASVGIRLSDDLKPHDRLGLQLKSFTEWLKTMKKLHVVANDLKSEGEAQVPVMAEKSNLENEVVTEAMAEVLLQQGKTTKAREVYQKLSLLNPAKSAFFADKIEQMGG